MPYSLLKFVCSALVIASISVAAFAQRGPHLTLLFDNSLAPESIAAATNALPGSWNPTSSTASPLDEAVSFLIEELNDPQSQPSFVSLKQIYGNRYASVPAIRKTIAQLRGLELSVEERRAAFFPKVTLGSSSGRSNVTRSGTTTSGNLSTITLAADQLLFDFGATTTQVGIASTRLESGINRIGVERMEVLYEMIRVQLDFQKSRKLIVFYDAFVNSRERFYSLIKQKVDLGASSQLDLSRAKTSMLEAKSKIPTITGEVFRTEGVVQELFGGVPDFAFAFYQIPKIPVNFPGGIDKVVATHPAVLEAQKNLEIARAEVAYLEQSALGSVRLTVSRSNNRQPASANSSTNSAYIEYTNTLFDGFAHRSKTQAAITRTEEFGVELERVQRKTRQQLLTALSEYQTSKNQLDVRRELLMSAKKSSSDLMEAFLLNLGSLTDVFNAEEAYFSAAESTVQSMVDFYTAYYRVLHEAGLLSEAFELNT